MNEEYQDDMPVSSDRYLAMVRDAEKAFQSWQDKSTNIEKKYANLSTMTEAIGDRQFQIFWANMEVLGQSIYSRPPAPVVAPRHKDSGEVEKIASEMLERVLEYDVEDDDLHETLVEVRDDLKLSGRGVPWVLDNGKCIHVDRRDFVHEPARKWAEVGWVARRAYLDRDQMSDAFPDADVTRAQFKRTDGHEDEGEEYRTTDKKAQVWEIWHKTEGRVVWITEGVKDVLGASEPLVDVKGFFPCPKPAYATLERGKLIPVPDFVYYRDQVDEIDELTARISSLSESLRLKGFYASGTSEIGEAIETAMKATDNKAILVPVSNFAALGGGSLKDAIIWLPVAEIAQTITALVDLRKQLIEDVYEISGISDIMRGESVASETATAQNLKAQYGSVRVRGRQMEMVRIARDILRLKGEIYAENYEAQELAQMAAMQVPDQAAAQMQAMQAMQQGQEAKPVVTIEHVDQLLKSQRLRPFLLEIESDSTIAPNEAEEKASRMEFVQTMGGFIQQAQAMVMQAPQTAPFAVELMKFAAGAFRAGRELSGALDEFAETVKASAQQAASQQGEPDPAQQAEAMKVQGEMQRMQAEMQKMSVTLDLDREKTGAEVAKILAEVEKIQAETVRIMNEPAKENAA